jgi:CreA protein
MVALFTLVFALSGCGVGGSDREVGSFANDLTGNAIRVDALADPLVPGVVCHLSYFERSVVDRALQGNWFEDPSNAAVACQRTGPIDISRAPPASEGAEVFSERQGAFFRTIALRRIVDVRNRTIVYVAHGRELVQGSAKMAMSTVLLTPEEVATAGTAQ